MDSNLKRISRNQGTFRLPFVVWLTLIGVTVAVATVLLWPRPKYRRQVTRNPSPGETRLSTVFVPRRDRGEPDRMNGPRMGGGPPGRYSQPVYEGTNLGNWYGDLKSSDPATVARAREALAALGVEVPGSASPTNSNTLQAPKPGGAERR